ncbi:MAG: NAD(P)H-dependent oxidoreductase [Gammaproteobacteria bacterium]
MNILILDGHPDAGRLTTHLLDRYAAALPAHHQIGRIAVRDLDFAPNLQRGYQARTPWEPDVARVARALDACDHLVVGFPMWWGGEPALLKGLLDRVLLPGFAFHTHAHDVWWDRLLAGRSGDAIITMDTPPLYLRIAYGNPVVRRWRHQVFGYCGIAPSRILPLGPTNRGGTRKHLVKWEAQVARLAETAPGLRRPPKVSRLAGFLAASGADAE